MARFVLLKQEIGHDIWLNIDTIVTMYYDKEDNATYIFSSDSPSEHIIQNGDITSVILNANNTLTMNDRLSVNHIYDKFKSVLSMILARLDNLSKNIDDIRECIRRSK